MISILVSIGKKAQLFGYNSDTASSDTSGHFEQTTFCVSVTSLLGGVRRCLLLPLLSSRAPSMQVLQTSWLAWGGAAIAIIV